MRHSLPEALPDFEHIKRYWNYNLNATVAKILPGEYYVTCHNEILTTVVGSCVTACICDRVHGVGGMNHFMLPHVSKHKKWEHTEVSAESRYGSFAMEYLINEILKYGGNRRHLEVKLFGGGRIMGNQISVGQQNIDFVKNYVHTERLNLVAEDLGNVYPRKILFYPADGRARVKKLRSMEQIIVEREKAYQRNLEKQPNEPTAGEVELF